MGEQGLILPGGDAPMEGAIDLGKLRGPKDVMQGFRVSGAFIQVQTDQGPMQVPLLDLEFTMANGEVRKGVSVPPEMIIHLIRTLSDWGAKVMGGVEQV